MAITPDGLILAGHGLVEAAKAEGWSDLACHIYDGPYPEAFLAIDNRASDLAEDDEEALATLLRALDSAGQLDATGWERDDLEELLLRLVEDLGKIQSTHSELAAVLGCHLDTVKDRLKNDAEFSAAYEKGLENGKSSLRRIQWKSALGGNTTMQIWLGKQYLLQRDMHATELTGAKGERLIPGELVVGLDEDTRALLRNLRARLPRSG